MATTTDISMDTKDKKPTDTAPLLDQPDTKSQSKTTRTKAIRVGVVIIIIVVVAVVLIWYFTQEDDAKEQGEAWTPTSDCDPINPKFCQLPWPNNFWLEQDSDYNQISLNFSNTSIPQTINGPSIDVTRWNLLNGFSPLPTIMAYFDDLSLMNTPDIPYLWNSTHSDSVDSPIVLLQVSTNTFIPIWVELDYSSLAGDVNNASAPDLLPITPESNLTLLINPMYRLNDGERYIVAIRNLRNNDNELIEPQETFARLRDGDYTETDDESKRSRYYDRRIFNKLKDNGIEKDTLQLCWDFTVMSTDYQTNVMLKMREDAYDSIEDDNVIYSITEITDAPEELQPNIARKVLGTISVPWYLNSADPGADVRIVYENENDLLSDPVYQDNIDVPFELLIPYSAINGTISPNFLIFGHGLFQDYTTIEGISEVLNDIHLIGGAVSFIGMSNEDQIAIVSALAGDMTDLLFIPDRLHQAMINFLFLNKLMLSDDFINDDSVFDFNGSSVVPEEYTNYYVGASLGGIYGSVFLTLCSEITQGVLLVPGFPFELLLPRSTDFSMFFNIIKTRFDADLDRLWLLSFIQLFWTQMSPSGYLSHLNDEDNLLTDDDTVSNVLINYNLGDSQVSWIGAYNMGRTLDCYMYESQIVEQNETLSRFRFIGDHEIIDLTGDDSNACKIQGWYFEHPIIPLLNIPPKLEHNTHANWQQNSIEGIEYFFHQNKIDNSCYGPCIDIANISDTDVTINCTLAAGVYVFGDPTFCSIMEYPLLNMDQNECHPSDVSDPDNSPCGFRIFCNCENNQLVSIFYENDPDTGEINCLNREKLNANIIYSNDAESCQPIVLGDRTNKCAPQYGSADIHVVFDELAMDSCCQC